MERMSRLMMAMAAAAFILLGIQIAAEAQESVKIGFIEDYSGDIAIYGIQKLHAAQLAVKEINDGFMLKGGPVGSGGLGVFGKTAPNPPTMKVEKGTVKVLDEGLALYRWKK